ncbi:MAG TPA: hypothetical protein VJ343_02835, partial [archaeon]|nr:hypothetical protein [archaeon]
MEKRIVYLILLLALSATMLTLYKLDILKISGYFVGFGQPDVEFEWWNSSWHYRVKLEINS